MTLFCLLLSNAKAQDKPVMTWLLLHLPPFIVVDEGKPGKGIVNIGLRQIIEKWPEVDHKYMLATPARGEASLQSGVEACVSGYLVTPRRQSFAHFSSYILVLPHQLIVKRTVARSILRNNKGEVLPANLFDRSDLRGLIVSGRSYGPLLDELLSRRSKASGIMEVGGIGSNPLEMMAFDRADYLVEYEASFAYAKEMNPQFSSALDVEVLPVAGTTALEAGIACPRTEWGKQAVKKLDLIVSQLAGNERYAENFNWMSEASRRANKRRLDDFREKLIKTPATRKYDD